MVCILRIAASTSPSTVSMSSDRSLNVLPMKPAATYRGSLGLSARMASTCRGESAASFSTRSITSIIAFHLSSSSSSSSPSSTSDSSSPGPEWDGLVGESGASVPLSLSLPDTDSCTRCVSICTYNSGSLPPSLRSTLKTSFVSSDSISMRSSSSVDCCFSSRNRCPRWKPKECMSSSAWAASYCAWALSRMPITCASRACTPPSSSLAARGSLARLSASSCALGWYSSR
mmetsp:Transcript_15583/g.34438  ORF Transcript_15583/g.34438 Transcript_15583/m.34438 type:complete len:230 (-) Transcript_15583:622-1311(-)